MVKGTVVARLFGVHLLRVTADVVLVPADVRQVDVGVVAARRGAVAHPTSLEAAGVRRSTDGSRPTLRDARRLVLDADELLERADATPSTDDRRSA